MAYLKNSDLQSMFSQLGYFRYNEFVLSDNCYDILLHIYEQLNSKDRNSLEFKQIIGFSQLVKKNFIPILVTVKQSDVHILELVIKILVDIMTPIECLMSVSQLSGQDIDCLTVLKLNWMLSTSKNAFADLKVVKRIIDTIKGNMAKLSCSNENILNNIFTGIIDCLHLIKNILHVPNYQYQNRILWMLFTENFDEIIMDLITNTNRKQWIILVIELIALIFKHQHVDQMTNLLSKNNNNSDTSEDNESNTSPHPVPFKEKLQCNKNVMNKQDIGFLTTIGQSLNEKLIDNELKDQSVFKEPASLDIIKKAVRAKQNQLKKACVNQKNKSMGRSKNKMYNKKAKSDMKKKLISKSLEQKNPMLVPNHVNIPHFLQKFTVTFLRNGFNILVEEIHDLLTTNTNQYIDSSLYFWILTYFCRFCKVIKIDLKLIRQVVSFKLISFIVHEGFKVSERLMIAKRRKSHDIHLQVRHLHLVIMAIKELIKLIEYYIQTSEHSLMNLDLIQNLKCLEYNSMESITWAKDLESMFELLIRQYDSSVQTIDYLHDLIITNHMALLLFDSFNGCWNLRDSVTSHIKKFAAPDLMLKYGTVLQNYKQNSEFINEAVLTMMHHITGEVENTTVLFQPIIVKTFLNIIEEKNPLFDRWYDLIGYVINKQQMPKII